jgi:hypothetical protein
VQEEKRRCIGGTANLDVQVVVRHREAIWMSKRGRAGTAGNHLYTAAFQPVIIAPPVFWLPARFSAAQCIVMVLSRMSLTGVRGFQSPTLNRRMEYQSATLEIATVDVQEVVYAESGWS